MNPNTFKHIKNDPAYSLTPSERTLMRTNLLLHMENTTRASTPSTWFVYLMRPMPLTALALIVTVSLTSVSYAARGALPGELLYGVKVSVNEKIERALASSPEAKAYVYVRQAEERLKETEVLAVQGTLDGDVVAKAAEEVSLGVDVALAVAKQLQEEGDMVGAENIHTRVSLALLAHGELLTAQAENFSDESRSALEMLSSVAQTEAARTQEETARTVHETGDTDIVLAVEALQERTQERVEELENLLSRKGIPKESREALETERMELTDELERAVSLFANEDFEGARLAFEDIDRRAHRAYTLLQTAYDIAKQTDQEVVIVLEVSSQNENASGATALRAKTAEPESATTMMMTLDATTATLTEIEEEEVLEIPVPKLQFRIREEGAE